MDSDLLFGRNPIAGAAAAVYMAANGHDYRSLHQVSEVSGINVKTLKSTYDTIKNCYL